MNIKHLKIGILHSLIGKNDGVSIVIDQTVYAMVKNMHVNLGNIYFLAAHTSPRFNAETNDIFWHKNEIHRTIIRYYNHKPPAVLEDLIIENAQYAKKVISRFVEQHDIDLLIAHNTSHPYNFITAVGLNYYIEERRARGIIWPKVLVWWHDSHYERDRFKEPNDVIRKYLKYLPGTQISAIAFINTQQIEYAKKYFNELVDDKEYVKNFFRYRTNLIPNSSDIFWEWRKYNWEQDNFVKPPQDKYNDSFFNDVGLLKKVQQKGFELNNTVILLQHTRIVPRKRIERTIDLAFKLDKRFQKGNDKKCIAILISGYSGDEQTSYKEFLKKYFREKEEKESDSNVIMVFGENVILSHRDIIVDRKYYKFEEIPAIVAGRGGLGTYFSEVEGFGNNLLEMMSYGLPVVINKYDTYKSDIEKLGFELPATEKCEITNELVESAYVLLTDVKHRNRVVKHNLEVLDRKLSHKIIADKMVPFIREIFTRELCISEKHKK
jgi:hypothetical protein